MIEKTNRLLFAAILRPPHALAVVFGPALTDHLEITIDVIQQAFELQQGLQVELVVELGE